MPLRDHFRPPVASHHSWEGLHGCWPTTMVMQLVPHLPAEFTAEPRVHLGTYFELDVNTYEHDAPERPQATAGDANGGVATAAWAPPAPTLVLETDLAEQYEYEVLVYDQSRGRQLVAAVEIVSPANKDRPEHRRLFVAKCAALLQKGVSVSVVDVVTVRPFNLYGELLALLGHSDPTPAAAAPAQYAATCRGRNVGERTRVETWAFPLQLGQPLPTLPLWLGADLAVGLDLEASYEQACQVLRIR